MHVPPPPADDFDFLALLGDGDLFKEVQNLSDLFDLESSDGVGESLDACAHRYDDTWLQVT